MINFESLPRQSSVDLDPLAAMIEEPPGPEHGSGAPVAAGSAVINEAEQLRVGNYHKSTRDETPLSLAAMLGSSILDEPIAVTSFPTIGASRKTERHISMRRLARDIEAARAHSKEGLPWFKLARFGDKRTDKGSLRNNANVLSVTGIEADYDAGEMSLAEAERRLREADVAAMLYTTAKHTEEAPRWRVFAPFAEAHEPNARTCFMERLNGILDGTLDGASFTLSQSYYGGNVNGRPNITVRLVDGRPIDRADELDATALPKGKCRDNGETADQSDQSGSGTLFALAAQIKRVQGSSLDDLRAALAEDENKPAADHIAKEAKAGKGRGERAIQRAWDRAPEGNRVDADTAMDEETEADDFEVSTKAKESRLRLLSPGECADAPSRGYIIKGVVAPGDVGCIFGAPGAGKSLISPHLGYAVAQGRGAFGMRTKAGRVFYVAAEDPHGMRGRVSALKLRHGNADDFTLVEGVSDLLAKGSPDFTALLAAVAEHKPSLIFIDTLAMAFPGLEENSAEDMGRVVALARRLAAHGAAVVLIHHDTKAGTPTPRGHSLLNGALDMALQLFAKDESGIVRGKLTKNRNGSCDRDIAFRIATEYMGDDEDGDPITVAIVDELAPGTSAPRQKLSASQRAALKILSDMIQMSGNCPVPEDDWRAACIEARTVSASEDRESRRRAIKRAFEGLARKSAVILRNRTASITDISRSAAWSDGSAFDDDPLEDET